MYRKIIKVFLGSPGDLEDERKVAKSIVDEENANHANQTGYHIDLVGWEDTVSQRRRAQDAINIDLDQCEYFVGLMWKKWGTPPGPEGHPYSSGFEEEYRRSVDRHEKTGKPEISLLFKGIDKDELLDLGPQLKKVLHFQEEISKEQKQFYQKFDSSRDFERKFRAIIAKFLRDQKLEDQKIEASVPQKPRLREGKSEDQQESGATRQVFDNGARKFIDDLIEKGVNPSTYSAADVARFRLLASTLSRLGNDNLVLGTHDANLVYRHLRNTGLSERERRGLLSAGLENLESATVPVWHWVFEKGYALRQEIQLRTLLGTDGIRRNAFRLLQMLSIAPKDFEGELEIERYLDYWFSEDASTELVVAALDYLGFVGDEDVEVAWEKVISSSAANIAQAAVRAKARIITRTNATEALRFVAKHDSTELGTDVAEELLANASMVETKILRDCLKNRTIAFVRKVASELESRAALEKADAQLLCENASAEIRLIGVRALRRFEPNLTMADARKLLVKPRKAGGLVAIVLSRERDYPGEDAFEKYSIGVLSKLSYEHLLKRQEEESFFSTAATLALFSGHFKRVRERIERDLLDGFETFCNERCASLVGTSVEPSPAMFRFVQENLRQSALEIFCAKASGVGIPIVRKLIDEFEVKFAPEIVRFLARHGDWNDASRIAKLSRNVKYGLGLTILEPSDQGGDKQLAARAILKLSGRRIADAWGLELPAPVRVQFVVEMSKKLFSLFDDQSIIDMLLVENDAVREVVALKSVLCFSRTRLIKIRDAYYNIDGNYFYNVIFWLDLGISADRAVSQGIALREIEAK